MSSHVELNEPVTSDRIKLTSERTLISNLSNIQLSNQQSQNVIYVQQPNTNYQTVQVEPQPVYYSTVQPTQGIHTPTRALNTSYQTYQKDQQPVYIQTQQPNQLINYSPIRDLNTSYRTVQVEQQPVYYEKQEPKPVYMICQTQSSDYTILQKQLNYQATINLELKSKNDGLKLVIKQLEEIILKQGSQNDGSDEKYKQLYDALQLEMTSLKIQITNNGNQYKFLENQNQELRGILKKYEIDINNWQYKCQNYERELEQLRAIQAKYEQAILNLKDKNDEHGQNLSQKDEEIEQVKRHGKKHQLMQKDLEDQLAQKDNEIEELQKLVKKQEKTIEDLQDQLAQRDMELEQVNRSGKKLEKTIKDLQEQLSQAIQQANSQAQGMTQTIKDQTNTINFLQAQVEDLINTISKLKKQLKDLQDSTLNQGSAYENQIKELKSTITSLQGQLLKLNSEYGLMVKECNNLKSDYENQIKELNITLISFKKQLQESQDFAQNQKLDYENQIKELKITITSLQRQVYQFQVQVTQYEATIVDLRAQLTDYEKLIKELRSTITSLEATTEDLRAQLTENEQLIKKLKMDATQLKGSVTQSQIKIDSLTGQLEQLIQFENQIKELEITIEDQTAEIEKLKKQLKMMTTKYEETQREYSSYRLEIEERETVKRHAKKVEHKPAPPKVSHEEKFKQALDLFHQFDSDHQSVLDYSEIKALLSETYKRSGIGSDVTQEDIEYWLSLAEAKSDKQITLAEYEVVIRKQMDEAK